MLPEPKYKTTHQLVDMMDNLLVGPSVVFYVWPNGQLSYPLHLMAQILSANFRDFYQKSDRTLYLPDTDAEIEFIPALSLSRRVRGLIRDRPVSVVLDHEAYFCDDAYRGLVNLQHRAAFEVSRRTRLLTLIR